MIIISIPLFYFAGAGSTVFWIIGQSHVLICNTVWVSLLFRELVISKHLWRNWLARSAVNRKVAGSSPARCELNLFFGVYFVCSCLVPVILPLCAHAGRGVR